MQKATFQTSRFPRDAFGGKPRCFKTRLFMLLLALLVVCSVPSRALTLGMVQTVTPLTSPAPEEHGPSQKPVEIAKPFGFPITNSMIASLIVAAGLIIFALVAIRRMTVIPGGTQNFWEWLVESLYTFLKGIIGSHLVKRTFWFLPAFSSSFSPRTGWTLFPAWAPSAWGRHGPAPSSLTTMVVSTVHRARRNADTMDNQIISTKRTFVHLGTSAAVACLLGVIFLCSGAFSQDTKAEAQQGSSFQATHVLGLPDTRHSASGSLAVEGGSLRFESSKQGVKLIPIASIQAVLLSQEDKQMGGTPMKLGKMAAPYGGGRVVSLFAHKKYDYVSLLYRDENGGIHGVIFEVPAGEGMRIREALASNGAHVAPQENPPKEHLDSEIGDASIHGVAAGRKSGSTLEADGKWSVQVEEVGCDDVNLDPAFRVAIYEDLLTEVEKTNKFEQIYRSGDHRAESRGALLTLKIKVLEFEAGSETKRAVTTVTGATKIKVQSELQTRDGKVVKEDLVDANVRFFGNNLSATHKLAKILAGNTKDAKLPEPTASVSSLAGD